MCVCVRLFVGLLNSICVCVCEKFVFEMIAATLRQVEREIHQIHSI